ncbi:CDP-alcohol phosphatidyltransferase family protein [Nocardiopsis suaedae]|uniref:Phosphatidate cytidylyltransferase n=1 Tax=Nocardiopsis suaedae TaxID=3018444 RepID=A0ABT4TF21_9ACTN|nr:CDP-alcohol phosphatidyltransferase family protein [Nocardiopsis suaedae]MDA2803298.1 phosphatidate cytidylyltransferase [Nocardiopsis suaedae]
MDGLYALKPWFADRLASLRSTLVARGVAPAVLTWGGVAFGAAAGGVIAALPPGPIAAGAVGALLVGRLACANLDGGVARESGRSTRAGALDNELGDRLAEFAVLAGCLAAYPAAPVLGAALAATLPSWVSLAGAAAGAPRLQGGPSGKTERCAQFVLLALTGFTALVFPLMILGSLVTAALRLVRVRRELRRLDTAGLGTAEPAAASAGSAPAPASGGAR